MKKSIPFIALSIIASVYLYSQTNSLLILENERATIIRKIFDEALVKGQSYQNLTHLCKQVGNRLAGSPQAAAAVEWGRQTLLAANADTVYLQPCMVTHWVRGQHEEGRFISKRIGHEPIKLCALGGSVATDPAGLHAPIIMIQSLSELDKLSPKQVKGKIVYLHRPFDEALISTFSAYSGCAGDRYTGAPKAAKLGAVGFILRSLGSPVDDYPHTGSMGYVDSLPKIPAAAVSTKSGDWMKQMIEKDPEASFYLNLDCQSYPDAPSFNVIGEIKGTEHPEEVILVGGHLDSWDKGEGAHDDGAGVVHSIEVLRILKAQGLKPKRTIRCVLFMNEENGAKGAKEYARVAAIKKTERCIFALESDRGGFTPRGFSIDALPDKIEGAYNQVRNYNDLLAPYGIHQFEKGLSGVDVAPLKEHGTVTSGYIPDSQRYFDYHHTDADVLEAVNQRELELGAGAITALIWLISEDGWK